MPKSSAHPAPCASPGPEAKGTAAGGAAGEEESPVSAESNRE